MVGNTKAVLEKVVSIITPPSEELSESSIITKNILARVNKKLKGVGAKAVVGGSGKKQTQLRETKEIDIFVLFNYKKYRKNSNISDILEHKLKKEFKLSRLHGSRDYFQTKHKGYTFEIVPILNISTYTQAENITDVSPLHAKWVGRKAKGRLSDIRLTKAFLSALGIYGAESYVRGFSGYACEVLTIHYKSFLNLLRAAAKWKVQQIVDPEGVYKNKNVLLELNKSKTVSPLVVIDPVQPTRNVTAALNDEAFNKFIKTARRFLKKPSVEFFKRKIITKQDLINSHHNKTQLLILEVRPSINKTDVMGAAILHKYELVNNTLLKYKFKIVKSGWSWPGRSAMLWYFINKKLPAPYELRKGPGVSDKLNSIRFRGKHKKVFVKNKRLFTKVKVKFLQPKNLVKALLHNPDFKRKIESMRVEWH